MKLREINGIRWEITDHHAEAEGPASARPSPEDLPVDSATYISTDTQIEYRLFPNKDDWMMKPLESDPGERFV